MIIAGGKYTISFPSTYCGECELSIQVNGSETMQGKSVCPFLGPWGIAVSQNGHIFVVDNGKHQIHVFDKQKKYIRSFGQQGWGNGQHVTC